MNALSHAIVATVEKTDDGHVTDQELAEKLLPALLALVLRALGPDRLVSMLEGSPAAGAGLRPPASLSIEEPLR